MRREEKELSYLLTRLDRIEQAPELAGYFAQFSRGATRPDPKDIVPCTGQKSASDADNGQANG